MKKNNDFVEINDFIFDYLKYDYFDFNEYIDFFKQTYSSKYEKALIENKKKIAKNKNK